jgi:hypothetical protein
MNKKESKDKDNFCKQMGLGLKMLIQKESKKNLKSSRQKESKNTKSKGQLVKKAISKNRVNLEKKIRRERRRSQIEKNEKAFRLSHKFKDEGMSSEKKDKGSQEPLNERIQRLIESVSGENKSNIPSEELKLQDLVNDGIITPKVLPRFHDNMSPLPDPTSLETYDLGLEKKDYSSERNRILEEEIEKTGILETLLVENPEDFLCVFEQMQAMENEKKRSEMAQNQMKKQEKEEEEVQGLEVVHEDDETDMDKDNDDKDPLWSLEQKVAAKLNQKLDKLKEKRNSYEYKMDKLKRDGKRFLFRRQVRAKAMEPMLRNKQGKSNS